MPWNRSGPLTAALVWNTIVTPPVAGSILDVQAGESGAGKDSPLRVRGILSPIPATSAEPYDRKHDTFRARTGNAVMRANHINQLETPGSQHAAAAGVRQDAGVLRTRGLRSHRRPQVEDTALISPHSVQVP